MKLKFSLDRLWKLIKQKLAKKRGRRDYLWELVEENTGRVLQTGQLSPVRKKTRTTKGDQDNVWRVCGEEGKQSGTIMLGPGRVILTLHGEAVVLTFREAGSLMVQLAAALQAPFVEQEEDIVLVEKRLTRTKAHLAREPGLTQPKYGRAYRTAYCGTKLEEPTWVARKVPFLPASGVLCPSCLRSYKAALRKKTNPSTVEEPNNDE
jgi:hypothetical protein